jgi:hypothetical protein
MKKKADVNQFKAPSRYMIGRTEENLGETRSEQPVSGLRFKSRKFKVGNRSAGYTTVTYSETAVNQRCKSILWL